MLLVKQPGKPDLIAILRGLLDERVTREEVVSWWQAVDNKFGPCELTPGEGLWYYLSLSILTIPISLGDGEPWFIRRRDIEEYLLDLQRVGTEETWEGVTRVRSHQTDLDAVRWPLLMFEHTDVRFLERLGLKSVRGVFDPHLDLVEHTHLYFRGDLYLVVRQYDDQAHQLMILGTSRDEDQ
ncbi:MAG TPA: hypothetical protein VJ998_07315, partial [Pseudomonadales bacterium]|nr:hypothetical protein [Pseudomonadales bacterium]